MFDLMPFETRKNMPSFFDDFEKHFFGGSPMAGFKTDIIEKDNAFVLQAELPGFDKQDIHIDLSDDMLTISAEHKEEKEDKDKDGNYIHRERTYGSFSRSFHVANVDTDNISAAYENGVLVLTLPKQQPQTPPTKTIVID